MTLGELIHASTRPSWTARLVVYLAIVVTVSTLAQVVAWLWL